MKMPLKFQSWFVHKRKREVATFVQDTEWSKSLELSLFHGGLLAFDLCKLELNWPEWLLVYSNLPETETFSNRFLHRSFKLGLLPLESFQDVDYQEMSLDSELEVFWEVVHESVNSILNVEARGRYPIGSAGDAEGSCLYRSLCFLADLHEPHGLLVDLTHLEYTWGDNLALRPPQFIFVHSIFAMVVADHQREAVAFLGEEQRTFSTNEEAIQFLIAQMLPQK
jgi:hypothetical protein